MFFEKITGGHRNVKKKKKSGEKNKKKKKRIIIKKKKWKQSIQGESIRSGLGRSGAAKKRIHLRMLCI